MKQIKGVLLAKQKIIPAEGGDVLHGIKRSDNGYQGFGEAYFSEIQSGAIKAWKRHREMTLNFIVPLGKVKFVLFEDEKNFSEDELWTTELSRENYYRLTIPPMIWVGFMGASDQSSLILNVANVEHDPIEVDHLEVNEVEYSWF